MLPAAWSEIRLTAAELQHLAAVPAAAGDASPTAVLDPYSPYPPPAYDQSKPFMIGCYRPEIAIRRTLMVNRA